MCLNLNKLSQPLHEQSISALIQTKSLEKVHHSSPVSVFHVQHRSMPMMFTTGQCLWRSSQVSSMYDAAELFPCECQEDAKISAASFFTIIHQATVRERKIKNHQRTF